MVGLGFFTFILIYIAIELVLFFVYIYKIKRFANQGGIQMMKKKVQWLWLFVFMCILSNNGIAEAAVQSNQTKSDTMNYKYEENVKQPTSVGIFKGLQAGNNNTLVWSGIPYAQAPVGDLRWKAPQPISSSPTQHYNALQAGNICTQLAEGKVVGDEDCLYLNIYRPHTSATDLPVLVFLHGGGNVTGSSAALEAQSLATSTDSVVVTVNYRLGLLGWIHNKAIQSGDPAEDSGNFALLDQIAALKWVQQQIGSFGGDANNVTLGGQSAGARDVLALVISPLAKGLFTKAMPLSGGMTTATPAEGQAYSNTQLAKVLVQAGKITTESEALTYLKETDATTLQQTLRSLDSKQLVQAVGSVMIRMSEFPHLFADGYVLPKNGFDVVQSGKYNRVPMLIGSMKNEFNVFAAYDPEFSDHFTKNTWDKAEQKQFWQATEYGSQLYSAFNADQVANTFTQDSKALPIYVYRFAWGTDVDGLQAPAKYLSATHGVDMDFLSGNFAQSNYGLLFKDQFYKEDNQAGRVQLMHRYRQYIRHFLHDQPIHSGALPVWQSWQQSGQLLQFDANNKQANIKMIEPAPTSATMKKSIQSSLSEASQSVVWDNVLKGRFFMESQY